MVTQGGRCLDEVPIGNKALVELDIPRFFFFFFLESGQIAGNQFSRFVKMGLQKAANRILQYL